MPDLAHPPISWVTAFWWCKIGCWNGRQQVVVTARRITGSELGNSSPSGVCAHPSTLRSRSIQCASPSSVAWCLRQRLCKLELASWGVVVGSLWEQSSAAGYRCVANCCWSTRLRRGSVFLRGQMGRGGDVVLAYWIFLVVSLAQ